MILKKTAAVCFAAVLVCAATLSAAAGTVRERFGVRDPALAALFVPQAPVLGRYDVFADPRPFSVLARDRPIEALDPIAAFGAAGTYDRAALVRLYRGRRVQVARTWSLEPAADGGGDFESLTYISPYPDASLHDLLPGTLVIRWTCDHRDARCAVVPGR